MKIIALEYSLVSSSIEDAFAYYPDSTLIRNNDDFYVPNFSQEIVAFVGVYVQFSKIGKCIEPRFSYRYYTECGCAIKFIAADCIANCLKQGMSPDIARGFDGSLAVSNDRVTVKDTYDYIATYNGNVISVDGSLFTKIPELISQATQYFTVKIGDLFFIPLIQRPIPVSVGDVFDVSLHGKQLLSCSIK